MQNKELKKSLRECPFCGGEAELEKFYESCDGRGDRFAEIKCKCNVTMELTWEEWIKAQEDFNYTGGYYSQNKEFWNGMHQRLIDKWNTRKPMERIVEQLEEEKADLGEKTGYAKGVTKAIEIVRKGGGDNAE